MPLYGNDLSTGAFLTSNKQSVQTITGSTDSLIALDRTVVLSHENINVFKNGVLLTPESSKESSTNAQAEYSYVDTFGIQTTGILFTDSIKLKDALVNSDVLVILYNTFGGDVPDFIAAPIKEKYDETIENYNAVISCLKEVKTALENNDSEAAITAINNTVGTN